MLIVLVSAKGSPGVTTAAVALAATTPAEMRSVVVEADSSGGDLGAAFALKSEPGLVGLASAARRDHRPGLVWEHTQDLPGGLAVVPAPARPEQTATALDVLLASASLTAFQEAPAAEHDVADRETGQAERARALGAVWVDAGRLPPRLNRGEAVSRLLAHADVVLLVVRNDSAGIVHAASRLGPINSAMNTSMNTSSRSAQHQQHTPGAIDAPRSAGVLLVGGAGGYPANEVALALGAPVVGVLPWDPRATAVLWGRPARRVRNLARLPLLRATAAISDRLITQPTSGDEHQPGGHGPTGEHPAYAEGPEHPSQILRRGSDYRAAPSESSGPFRSPPGVVPAGVSTEPDGVRAPHGRRSR